MAENNIIVFRKGEETGIVIEKKDYENSLFLEQYKQAFGIIDEILHETGYNQNLDVMKNQISNIVAFCGERGEGKTSALMTVRSILLDINAFEEAQKAKLFPKETNDQRTIDQKSFKVLKLIDPAFFDDKHNLIELLLGQMYAELLWEENASYNSIDDYGFSSSTGEDKTLMRNELAHKFQRVRNSLSKLRSASNKDAYDKLEEIDELAAASMLREKMHDLLHAYAKYFEKERVLICIDDIDLNIKEGYTMAEEIRKYLSFPDVCIVMMALKIDQMVDVAKIYFKEISYDAIDDVELSKMAIRYVTKLIPQSHRIWMPKGESIVERPLTLIDNRLETTHFETVKEAVVQLIFRKTRYIFINGRNISPIVPTNLRELRHLIDLLWDMNDVEKESPEHISNKTIFKTYFYNTWIHCLDRPERTFVEELVKIEDLVFINKTIILYMREVLLSNSNSKSGSDLPNDELLHKILNPNNTVQNISIGDVFYVINYVDSVFVKTNIRNLLFFLKSFYSIKLYETYDIISESFETLFPILDTNKPSIYRFDSQYKQLNALQCLVNGAYFTYNPSQLLPDENRVGSRDIRSINGRHLIKLFSNLNKEDLNKTITQLHICEFFALTTTHPILYRDYRQSNYDYDRTNTERGYFDQFKPTNNFIVFNVLSIFYNIINIKFTYQRWNTVYGGDFYKDALECKESLLRKILKTFGYPDRNQIAKKWESYHLFVSDAIIRFSEVILSILDATANQRNVARTGNNMENLKNLYVTIQNIGIYLYPLKNGDNRYKLPFKFLDVIIQWLSGKIDDISVETFDNYYSIESADILSQKLIQEQLKDTIFDIKFTYPKTGKAIKEELRKDAFSAFTTIMNNDDWFENDRQYSKAETINVLFLEADFIFNRAIASTQLKSLNQKDKNKKEGTSTD